LAGLTAGVTLKKSVDLLKENTMSAFTRETHNQSDVGADMASNAGTGMSVLQRRRTINAYLFILPAAILLILFLFIPLAQVIYYSFTDYDMLTSPNWVGLDNYKNILDDDLFWESLVKSFTYLLVTPLLIVFSIILAIIVNRPLRGMAFFRAFYFTPAVISAVAIGIIFDFVFAESAGLINGILKEVGLRSKAIPFLTEPDYVLPTIMSVTLWRGVGYYMIIFLAGLQGIPEELYEAASIDGANSRQQHLYITVPMLRPVITFVAIISSISALRAFDEIFILTDGTGGLLNSGVTTMFYIYRQAFDFLNIGYAAAIAVIFTAMTMILSIISLRFLDQKVP
jgi:putative chitobiose transport system permease protein